jgi:abortive infection bacteriophage resistance protein
LRSLNFIRNVAAHHSRLWNSNVVELSPRPKGWPAALNHTRPFFYFCLMQQLMREICPNSSWGRRLKSLLEQEFPAAFSLAEFGVYPDWEEWDLWPQPGAGK